MNEFINCLLCNKKFKSVTNTHLKKDHQISVNEYLEKFPNALLKSEKTRYDNGNALRGKSYSEVFGIEIAKNLKEQRRRDAINQMKDEHQRKIRSENENAYFRVIRKNEAAFKEMQEKAHSKKAKEKRLNTMFERYGSNCALSSGRYSKQGFIFIKKYLKENNINELNCYFGGGGKTGKEYYQCIKLDGKFICHANYDLVVFNEKKEIEIILEYNGPWHYTFEEQMKDPDSLSASFYSKTVTKRDSYLKDVLKLNHAKSISKKVFVYWYKFKKLVEYNNEDSLKEENIK